MEKLSENEYLILEVDTEMSIYKYTWKSESKNLNRCQLRFGYLA